MNVVFLDRDGTIIPDPPDDRVDSIAKIRLFPDTLEALEFLAAHDYGVILITNQAGIAEGLLNETEYEVINNKLIEMLKPSGIKILKTYMCPHSSEDNCECRKPKPKMLLRAAEEFNLDLSKTYMVGDRPSDILAGLNAGAKTILVKTARVSVDAEEADYIAPTLLDAVKHIVKHP